MKHYSIFILLFSSFCYCQISKVSPIAKNSHQLIIVLTDSIKSTTGNLYRFERKYDDGKWMQTGKTVPVVIGRNGLGWGRGMNSVDSSKLPMKTEGDGRSPAGVFKLSSAFGYAAAEEKKGLKIPYIQITEMLECIDDDKSVHYNQIISRNEIKEVDWQSSEKMYFADIWYEQGVIVEQNTDPVVRGAGSCIFLHNWSLPNETSSGCTEMEPINMKEIIYWLDASANPILVQLTKQLYDDYQKSWELPNHDKILE